ncbi:hypothetical protein [Mucilaginibacter paludis]|uniref:Uncharacterized protein n=1 Tax=Mucilaginibacter paludis DSM 18603 TaxID=714943 RepID=H1Y3L7_9SPHI|nr:hypothetical protein [Mucilaginibacter paludis]EHQ29785.1 hypothetical protein Mucpa_5716 [Mucilaginibacter paludis DSM 18603]
MKTKNRNQAPLPNVLSRLKAKSFILTRAFLLVITMLSARTVSAQQNPKIQAAINSIKEAYYCEDQDYHTDGQRTVWVKSYKRWEPEDLTIMKKESPSTLRFLGMAAQRARYDVLEQLLPDYYREHGGVKAFANAVIQATQKNLSAGS